MKPSSRSARSRRREHMPNVPEPELTGDQRPRRILTGRVRQRLGHLADRPRRPARDVESADPWIRARQRDRVRACDIAHMDEIPQLRDHPRTRAAARPPPARWRRSRRHRHTACRAASAAHTRCGSAAQSRALPSPARRQSRDAPDAPWSPHRRCAGPSGEYSSTAIGLSSPSHSGHRGVNLAAARPAGSRGGGATPPCSAQTYAPSPYTTMLLASTRRPRNRFAASCFSSTAVPRSLWRT